MMTDQEMQKMFVEETKVFLAQKPEEPLIGIYEIYLDLKEMQERENGVRSKEYLHASRIGGCLRSVVLEHLGYAKEGRKESAPKRRIFDNGHSFHDRMKNAFRMSGVLLEEEGEAVHPGFRVGGKWDGKIDVGHGIEILELKSANQWTFGKKKELPLESHKLQVSTYMYVEEIYRTRFYYECKNTNVPFETVYEFEESMLEKALKRSMVAWRYIDAIVAKGDILNTDFPTATCIMPNQDAAKRCDCKDACFKLLKYV